MLTVVPVITRTWCLSRAGKKSIICKTAEPKTAKRKDAKSAEERKGKYLETILTGLVTFVFSLRL